MNHIWCPVCGWFGRKARRAARRHDGNALIMFHASLVRHT